MAIPIQSLLASIPLSLPHLPHSRTTPWIKALFCGGRYDPPLSPACTRLFSSPWYSSIFELSQARLNAEGCPLAPLHPATLPLPRPAGFLLWCTTPPGSLACLDWLLLALLTHHFAPWHLIGTTQFYASDYVNAHCLWVWGMLGTPAMCRLQISQGPRPWPLPSYIHWAPHHRNH